MTNHSLEHSVLVVNTLHIKTNKGGNGSAWLHFPQEDTSKAYLYTARHCLFSENETDFEQAVTVEILSIEPSITFSTTDKDCRLLTFKGLKKADDVAILIIPRHWFLTFAEVVVDFIKLPSLPIDCQLTGFPEKNNFQYKELLAKITTRRADEINVFEILVNNDLRTFYSDGKQAIEGMSGGGVVVNQGGKTYLVGIIIEFDETYKEISGVAITHFDKLLRQAHLPPLLLSYSNDLGLNPDKFSDLLDISRTELGNRYSPQLNFDLPIAQIFHGAAFDNVFQQRARNAFHNLLVVTSKNAKSSTNEPAFDSYRPYFEEQIQWFGQFYQNTKWSADSSNLTIDALKKLKKAVRDFFDRTREIQSELWNINEQLKKEQGKEKDYYRNPLGWSLSHIEDINSAIRDFDNNFLSHGMLQLAVSPYLIINGAAGKGKSHLLADIATQREKNGLPSLLILGQKMVQGDIWKQIMIQIDVNCTREELLKTLNEIGKHIGSRVLFIVDAINEGGGKVLWQNQLAGFIEAFRQYPFIGLVISVRSTYYDILVPEHICNDPSVLTVDHLGFAGHEWEVVQHFCKNFGLETPRFPILAPEFSNPQFLYLLCQGLQNLRQTIFPFGVNGIAWLYRIFTEGINSKILKTAEFSELAWSHINFIQKAVEYFADNIVDKEGHRLINDEAFLLFNKFDYCPKPNLLQVLLSENVLLRDMGHNWQTNKVEEFIQFSYERFGDFAIAHRLLNRYFDPNNPKATFSNGGDLKTYFQKDFYQKEGIFNAVILYLAEDYDLEVFEIISDKWTGDDYPIDIYRRRFHSAFLNSLEWRSIEKIDFEKIKDYINNEILRGYWGGNFFLWLLNFATIPKHPLNIELLHHILWHQSLAERDSWWIEKTNGEFTEEDSIIRRLINWAREEYVKQLDDEVAQLAATTLAWFLVSPNQELRDSSTLALVNLLESKPRVMVSILEKFKEVNDPYVSERLYAAAYGVALRSLDTEGVSFLAQWVFDNVFKNGQPPVHILLREYAQGIIEWALYQKMAIDVDVALIRPPYNSDMPDLPTEQDVAKFKIDYNRLDYQKDEYKNRAQNQISGSLRGYGTDRFDKTIGSAFEMFHFISFRDEQIYKNFKKQLKGEVKALFKLLEQSIKIIHTPLLGSEQLRQTQQRFQETLANDLPQAIERLLSKVSKTEAVTLINTVIPHIMINKNANNRQRNRLDYEPFIRWMLQRVFDLGWNKELHGEFDDRITRWADYGRSQTEAKVERIGKKYQWIAFHEMMARLTDNYYLNRDGIVSADKPFLYHGTWEMYLRNIDPTVTVTPTSKDDEWDRLEKLKYDNWDMPNKTWLSEKLDLPDVAKIIIQRNPKTPQYEWLNLYANPDWSEPTPFGEEKSDYPNKQIWYQIRSYLVKKSEEKAIVDWMAQQNFWNHWMPQVMEHHNLFNREFYWSAAYRDVTNDRKDKLKWSTFRGTRFKGIITTEHFSAGGGSYALQNGISFQRPAQYLFDKMALQYSPKDGEWINNKGNVIAFDPSVSSKEKSSLWVRRDALDAVLKHEKLAIVWTIMGEKQVLRGHYGMREQDDPLILNGVFSLNYGAKMDGKPQSYWFDIEQASII